MSLLIKNGQIVTADSIYIADIYCENETITKIGTDLAVEGAEIIDASGKYVFPGFIDPHVHIYLPFMGTFAKDTWETAGKAAIVGGTTTLIEMICPSRNEEPLEAFELWNGKAEGFSPCDFSFHMGVTRYDDSVESQLKEIINEKGLRSFKIFLAYKGAFGVTDDELYKTLKLSTELDTVVTAHCENADLISVLQNKLIQEGKTGPGWHEPSRPVQVEAEGCHHLMTFAEMTGAKVYVVHTSCDESIQVIKNAQNRGVKAWIETVIPYLALDKSYCDLSNFEGAKYVMSPPIRDISQQPKLWNHLANRTISTVGTDHAPFDFYTQKQMGNPDASKCLDYKFEPTNKSGNFAQIPNGLPSVEDRINLLYTLGVKTSKIDLHTFIDCASTQAAKIFGLFPRKGTIQIGADADLVVYDPEYKGKITAKNHYMATDYSAFEGMEILGKPEVVTVRGKISARNGKFVGKLGHGLRV